MSRRHLNEVAGDPPVDDRPVEAAQGERQGERHGERHLGRGLLRAALLLAAVAVAALALVSESARRADRDAVVAEIDAAPLPARRRERLDTWTERQNDPVQTRIELARFLVNETLSPEPSGNGTADPASLPLAHRLAAGAYLRRPAAWRAPALMGAALYLQRSLASDRRLITDGSAWEQPLLQARRLSPVADDPARFLAIAYLELWQTLPDEKRQEARRLLRLAFADERTFQRLIGPWLAIADEDGEPLAEALAVIPDQPADWQHLQRTFAESGDATSFFIARDHWRRVLAASLEDQLDEAAELRRTGDPYASRLAYLRVIAEAPTEVAFVPVVERALKDAPAGPSLPSMAPALGRWLSWALALDLVGANPLSAEAVDRLAGMVDGLSTGAAAHAAVAAGRLADAERLARRSPDPFTDDAWNGYLVSKARALSARHQGREALTALETLPASWQDRPSTLEARLEAAREAGDAELAVETEERLAALAAALTGTGGDRGAGTSAWRKASPPRRELVAGRRANGIEVAGRGGRGALVELRLDGRVVAGAPARGRPLTVTGVAVDPGLHLLEAVPVAGTFNPGRVRLLTAP